MKSPHLIVLALASTLGACAAVPGPGSGSSRAPLELDAFARDMLSEHDRVRADVGVGPLEWSPTLAAYAQEWADHLTTMRCDPMHRSGAPYGENLFMSSLGMNTVAAVGAWEQEKSFFHGEALDESNWYAAGHYTQIVWRSTRAVGCALAECAERRVVVCNYDPPGNVMGEKPY